MQLENVHFLTGGDSLVTSLLSGDFQRWNEVTVWPLEQSQVARKVIGDEEELASADIIRVQLPALFKGWWVN